MKYKKIEWFKPEFTENKLTVTMESSGKLRLSKGFLSILPKSIEFGFDKPTRTMFIKECKGNKGYHTRTVMPVKELPTAIKECGLKLPVRFQFIKDEENDLIKENKYYTRQSNEISMDKEYTTQRGGVYSLHDRIADNNSDYEEVENRIMDEAFFNTLTKNEKIILQMSLEKRNLPEICDVTNLSPDEILAIGKKINRKKKAFFNE